MAAYLKLTHEWPPSPNSNPILTQRFTSTRRPSDPIPLATTYYMYDTYLYCYRLQYVHSYLLQVYLTQLSIFSATLVYLNVISSTFIYLLIYPFSSVCIQLTIRGPLPAPSHSPIPNTKKTETETNSSKRERGTITYHRRFQFWFTSKARKERRGKNGVLFEKAAGSGEQEQKKSAFYDTQQVSG